MPPFISAADDYSVSSLFSDHSSKTNLTKEGSKSCSVHFDERGVVVHNVERYKEVTSGHLWYSKEETAIMKMRDMLILQLDAAGSFQESEEYTFRGLECRDLNGSFDTQNSRQTIQAVLDEQAMQKMHGIQSAERIAQLYAAASSTAKRNAEWLAQRDADCVLSQRRHRQQQKQQQQLTPRMSSSRPKVRKAGSLTKVLAPFSPSSKKEHGQNDLKDSFHLFMSSPKRQSRKSKSKVSQQLGDNLLTGL